jgi:hypothetical protein
MPNAREARWPARSGVIEPVVNAGGRLGGGVGHRFRHGVGKRWKACAPEGLAQAGNAILACVEGRLAAEELPELVLEGLLVEKLAAGQPVDIGPQDRDAIFIGVLDARLPRD